MTTLHVFSDSSASGWRFFVFLAGAVASLFAMPVFCAGEETGLRKGEWTLEADGLTSYKNSAEVIAEGAVVLRRMPTPGLRPVELQADWLRYDSGKQEVQARGNLLFLAEEERITASAVWLNLNDQTGILYDTTMLLKENNFYFSGRVLEKKGDATYSFEGGSVTACKIKEGQSAPWSFLSRSATVTVDEYAVLKHATFRIKDFTVFYIPYLVFPAQSFRESGLLFPEISRSSRSGLGIVAPYFVNISPSVDATLYPGFLERRGVNLATEFRYVLAADSRGTFLGTYLKDKTTDNALNDFKNDGYYRTTRDRYWLVGKADHVFGNSSIARLDVDLASDRDYLREFRDGVTGFIRSDKNFVKTFNRGLQEESIPFRESSIQLAHATDSEFFAGELRDVNDTTRETATGKQINTLPRVMYNAQTMLWDLPVYFDWQSEYVNYWRQEGLGYQRLDLYPRLRFSLPAGQLIEGRLRGGVRETFYQIQLHGDSADTVLQKGRNQNRTAYDFETNAALLLARDYALEAGSVRWFNHVMRPNLKYDYVAAGRQEEMPSLDSEDRVTLANGLTCEWNNYFKLGGRRDNLSYERYVGYFKVWQTYNLSEERRSLLSETDKHRPFSDVKFDLLSYPVDTLSVRYQAGLSVYGDGMNRYSLETRYSRVGGDYLSLDYIYGKGQSRDLKLGFQFRLLEEITVKADTTRSLLLDRTVSDSVGLIYSPHCWSFEVNYSKTSDDQRVMFIFSLAGLGKALEFGKDNL